MGLYGSLAQSCCSPLRQYLVCGDSGKDLLTGGLRSDGLYGDGDNQIRRGGGPRPGRRIVRRRGRPHGRRRPHRPRRGPRSRSRCVLPDQRRTVGQREPVNRVRRRPQLRHRPRHLGNQSWSATTSSTWSTSATSWTATTTAGSTPPTGRWARSGDDLVLDVTALLNRAVDVREPDSGRFHEDTSRHGCRGPGAASRRAAWRHPTSTRPTSRRSPARTASSRCGVTRERVVGTALARLSAGDLVLRGGAGDLARRLAPLLLAALGPA
jgi:hypothetical protein